jgi:sugar diacid utilization regulator
VRRSMVRDLLEGTAADIAAVRLGLDPGAPCAVLAFERVSGPAQGNRLLPLIELYCSTFRPNALTFDMGPRVYVVLTDVSEPRGPRRFAADAARRAASTLEAPVRAAVGGAVPSVYRAVASREEADRVMRVLLRLETKYTVADIDDVRAQANLLEVLDLLRERPNLQDGPLKRLTEDGKDKSEQLVATVRAYLEHFGDVAAAAQSIHVHPNTFRYRLRRATEVMGGALDDPDARLMLWLQLRLNV